MLFANPFKARMPLKAEALPGRDIAIWDGAPHCVFSAHRRWARFRINMRKYILG